MVAVAYERSFIAKFKSTFKRGFTKVVVTGAGRLVSDRKEIFDCIRVHQKIATFFKDFSRTSFDVQGPPTTRNIISQIVQKRTFPVHSNRT